MALRSTTLHPLSILVVLLAAAAAQGACPDPPAESPLAIGEVGLFFDTQGRVTCASDQRTRFYLVARVPSGGLHRYDLSGLDWDPETRPANLLVTLRERLPQDGPYEEGVVADGCDVAYAKAACPKDEGDVVVLASYELLTLPTLPDEFTLCLGAFTCPSIAGELPHAPTYDTCAGSTQERFDFADRICLTWSSTTTALQRSTWSVVKRLFR